VTAVDAYLEQLAAALHVRGAARRRFLRECRDHLVAASEERGPERAVRDFGAPAAVAAAFDAEVAGARGLRATRATVAGVLAVAASTLVLIQHADAEAAAPVAWAVAFFVAAQVAGVALVLAVLQGLAARRAPMAPADVALLVRRNGCALVAAGLTLVAAGGAVPGHASAALLLAGPVVAAVALVAVLRARRLVRRLGGSHGRIARPPLRDLARLTGLPVPALSPARLLLVTACVAGAAAFVRDRAEHGTPGGALLVAGIEVLAVLACHAALGGALGLRGRPSGGPLGDAAG
jgi:hypothetical protein